MKFHTRDSPLQPFLITVLFFFSTSCQRLIAQPKTEGFLTKSLRIQYAGEEELLVPDYSYDVRVWYKDDYIIQKIPVIRIRESDGISRWREDELYYTFLALKTRNYFRYSSFSDTASMLQCCYTTTDSLGVEFGWNYFYCNEDNKKSPSFLSDTTINGIEYRRAAFYKQDSLEGKKKLKSVYYLNRSRTDTTYTLNHTLTHEYKHPVTRIDYFTKNMNSNRDMRLIEQINFERDTLSALERTVFAKWIDNAKNNPVKYNAAKDSIYTPPFSEQF